ncbi:MAG: hypothetical protein JNM65_17870 [Verrucomicrobiaceae bacterium]|nr:hypothetical protein [Verrucomicrobiaceae bacterium]
METLSVRCNHCGAPLQVAENTRFVTCQFCQSSLEVKRTDSSVFTEEVAKIAENTGKMAESLEVLTVQNEIERLDRDHAPERMEEMSKHASPGMRTAGGCVGIVFMLIFTSCGLFFATEAGAPLIFQIAGGGFVLIGIIALVSMLMRAAGGGGSPRTEDYRRKRDELERQLEGLRQK